MTAQNPRPVNLIGVDLAAGTATFEVDDQTAAMVRRGMAGGLSISVDPEVDVTLVPAARASLIPADPPALELIDVNWPDGTVKVFPEREPEEVSMDILPDLGKYGRRVTQDIVDGLSAPIPSRHERRHPKR